jgi:hypothetical protein
MREQQAQCHRSVKGHTDRLRVRLDYRDVVCLVLTAEKSMFNQICVATVEIGMPIYETAYSEV